MAGFGRMIEFESQYFTCRLEALKLTTNTRPPPLSQGEKGRKLAEVTWKEIAEALMKENPEVERLAGL
jgi:hypothetical protein